MSSNGVTAPEAPSSPGGRATTPSGATGSLVPRHVDQVDGIRDTTLVECPGPTVPTRTPKPEGLS